MELKVNSRRKTGKFTNIQNFKICIEQLLGQTRNQNGNKEKALIFTRNKKNSIKREIHRNKCLH
jgi:hypothetical protein